MSPHHKAQDHNSTVLPPHQKPFLCQSALPALSGGAQPSGLGVLQLQCLPCSKGEGSLNIALFQRASANGLEEKGALPHPKFQGS